MVKIVLSSIALLISCNMFAQRSAVSATSADFKSNSIPGDQIKITIDTLSLFISDYNTQILENKRQVRISTGEISQADLTSKVPAVVGFRSNLFPATIRLKGDRRVHFEDGNVSYRVELSGDNSIFKMKRFSLHKPRAKNYIYESFFHKALIREKLIGLTYKFIRLFINHQDVGIYALEEFMDVNLIESSSRRAGPILHFSEAGSATILDLMDVEIFGDAPKDIAAKKIHSAALKKLTDFRNGNASFGRTFDRKKMADFFALTDILGVQHATAAKSVRYYFNPITEKMEPIGFDGHHGAEGAIFITAEMGIDPEVGWFYRDYHDWYYLLFSNPKTFDEDFFSFYMSSLKRMSEKKYIDSLFNDLEPSVKNDLAILESEKKPLLADHIISFGPDTFQFSKEVFYKRCEYISNLIGKKKRINAVLISNNSTNLKIAIQNLSPLPVELLSIDQNGKRIMIPPRYILLPARSYASDALYSQFEIQVTGYDPQKVASIEYRVLGLNDVNSDTILTKSSITIRENGLIIYSRDHDPDAFHKAYARYPFIHFNDTLKQFEIIKGKWTLSAPESIPFGYKLVIHEGVEVDLQKHAFLLINSPVEFVGTEKNPIIFHSSDSSGGLFVNAGGGKSKMEYVRFNNMAPLAENEWQLTGAVTFNESPVTISHCTFSNMKAEDGLNLVRSPFTISNTTFSNTQSDALDLDFSNGSVSNCVFNKCGNDCMDGSGSVIQVENVIVNKAGDKGISCGEQSTITATNCTVNDSRIGFASKDDSKLFINNCKVRNCAYGLVAFQKKNKFGPSHITGSNILFDNINNKFLIEENSSCVLDSKPVTEFLKGVRFSLYDIY